MKLKNTILSLLLVVGISLPLVSCQKEQGTSQTVPLTALESRGKGVYLSNCIACHNPNANLDGSIGPAVARSSLELLEARLLHQSYPPGYKPKRASGNMPEFTQLKDDIPALQAYLATFK